MISDQQAKHMKIKPVFPTMTSESVYATFKNNQCSKMGKGCKYNHMTYGEQCPDRNSKCDLRHPPVSKLLLEGFCEYYDHCGL